MSSELFPPPQPDNGPAEAPVSADAATPPGTIGTEAIRTSPGTPPATIPFAPSRAWDSPTPQQPVEIIGPTQASLQTERGDRPARRTDVMAALTPDAIRIQDTWRSQTIALRNLAVEKRRDGQELALHWGP